MGFLEKFFLCDDSSKSIINGELLRENKPSYSSNQKFTTWILLTSLTKNF